MQATPKFRRSPDVPAGGLIASRLSEGERERLCMDLLEEFGARNLRRRGDELIHSCLLPFGMHAHGDANPSASLNIDKLTYNCFSCGGGGLMWFIASCRGVTTHEARLWMAKEQRLGLDPEPLAQFLADIDALYAPHSGVRPPLPNMSRDILRPWYAIHPWLTEIRHIDEDNLMRHHVGWNSVENKIVIPHFWKGSLVGWQLRRLIDDGKTPKYKATPDFPRDTTLYNGDSALGADDVVVVEAPISVVSKSHLAPMLATFGSEVTTEQLRLISRSRRVIVWFDNDKAGWHGARTLIDGLLGLSTVFVVPSPWAADPADVDDDTFTSLIAQAVPASLWSPPNELSSWIDPRG
jgi:hypothetical protein